MNRELRTRLDLLRPSCESSVLGKQATQKSSHDRRAHAREFVVGDCVFARNLRSGPDWIPSTIVKVLGPVTYIVETDDGLRWKGHANQLKDRLPSSLTTPSSDPGSAQGAEEEFPIESSSEADSVPASVSEPPVEEPGGGVELSPPGARQSCYPQLNRHPPDTYE